MFFLHTPWHCDFTVLDGHMLRLLPYTVLSFHPVETNGMLDPGPFHLFQQIPFSHPFNLDGSFHTTVCTLPWQHNEHQSVALFHTDFYLVRSPRLVESLLLPISEVAEWLLPLICTLPFSFSHTGYFSLTLFRCDKSNPVSSLLNTSLVFWTYIAQSSRSPCWPYYQRVSGIE